MNSLLKRAIWILVVSLIAVIWGVQYRSTHQMAAIGAFFGAQDSTYSMAGWALGLGLLAFLIGIGCLIGGLVRAGKASSPLQ